MLQHDTAIQIGSGGMGEVYKAWDPTLERWIALKYLKHSDPVLVERLSREARAQARIDHPAICQVYEVGSDEGKPYIAMQYVDGRQLDVAAADLTIDQKILLIREVADAVHAAHVAGLIHRDLKPSNILVSEDGDGRLRPFVLDFGIAREQEIPGLTVTGQILGTPGYLSPEQALGEVTTLDRRTDVFSLGVILYELLSGEQPFKGDSQATQLISLLEDEAIPLRRRTPSLPRDLETVVAACLEKDPDLRYPSARALADDLGRYLNGEPVMVRRRSRLSRAAARARKHPAITGSATLALIAILVLSGLVLHSRWSTARYVQVAQRFGREVERMEGLLERAYLLPLHDIRRDAQTVRERMTWIDGELERLDDRSQALGHAAIGRGHLALGEPEAARARLERARELGDHSTQTSGALGLAYSELYRSAAEEAASIRNQQLREAALRSAETELREPARRYLELGSHGADHPAYLAATLASFSDDVEAALAHLDELKQSEPFYYRGDLLTGSIQREVFEEASRLGDEDRSTAAFAAAEAVFQSAAAIGESDPRPYAQLCGLWVGALRNDYWSAGRNLEGARDHALAACDRALTADPGSATAHLEAGRAWRYWAASQADHGIEDAGAFEAARRHAWQTLDSDPNNASAYVLLGVTHRIAANLRSERGDEPEEEYLASVAAYREAIRLRPTDVGAHMSLANTQLYLGDYARNHGRNPEPFFTAAVEASSHAVELAPEMVGGHVNRGIAYSQLAILARDHGGPAADLFAKATAALERAIELNPGFLTAHYNLGEALLEQSVDELGRGVDPTATIDHALDLLSATAEGYPTWAPPRYLQAEALAVRADSERLRGGDPEPFLQRANAELEAGRTIRSDDAVGIGRASLIYVVESRWRRDRGHDPSKVVTSGLALIDEAIAANPKLSSVRVRRAELLLEHGRWRLGRGQPPDAELAAAEAAITAALAINPDDATVHTTAARLWRLQAESRLAADAIPREEATRGLAAAARALAIDPSRAAAWAERSALHRLVAAFESDTDRRRRAITEADDARAEAIRINPLVEVSYSHLR
jgi:serine/threonine-protein kinase